MLGYNDFGIAWCLNMHSIATPEIAIPPEILTTSAEEQSTGMGSWGDLRQA